MRDTFIFVLFGAFIAAGTFLAWSGKVPAELVIAPVITGFLGLLADKPKFATTTTTTQTSASPAPATLPAPALPTDTQKDVTP